MLWKRKKVYLGVDIGTHTIKIVQVKSSGQLVRLERALAIPTPAEAFADGNLARPELISAVMQEAAREHRLDIQKVIAAVPEKHIITRHIKMPSMPEEEIASSLRWEVEKYIPLPSSELVLDYFLLSPGDGGVTGELDLILIAAPKKVIYPYCNLLVDGGFQPEAMETLPFALPRALCLGGASPPEEGPPPAFACLDIGASGTNVIAFRRGVPDFSRFLPIGGNYLTDSIAQIIGIDRKEAEQLKHDKGEILTDLTAPGEVDQVRAQIDLVIRPVLTDLAREVRRCLEYCQMQWKGQNIESLYLTGGTAMLKGLSRFMAEQLEVPVVTGNPLNCLAQVLDPDTPKDLQLKVSPIFSVAVGLALREVTA